MQAGYVSSWSIVTAAVLVQFIALESTRGQEFQNLNFEAVTLGEPDPGNPFGLPPVLDVPSWSFSQFNPPQLFGHIGSVPQQFLSTDAYTDDSGMPLGTPSEGHYSVVMALGYSDSSCGIFDPPCVWSAPSMEQTGVVPAGTNSIRLLGALDPYFLHESPGISAPAFYVLMNGMEIPLLELPNGQASGDVSMFAGSIATLRIELDVDYRIAGDGPGDRPLQFDAIEFTPAPEPTTMSLSAIGLAGIAALRLRRRACGDLHR